MSVRTVTVRLLADVGGFSSGMNQAERNVDQVGKKLLGVGLVAGAGLGLAVKKSMDFEAAMSAASAATQAQGKAFDALHDAAIKFGASTQYSATQAADAITAMAKAGVSATDILGGGLKGALDLAAAGQLSVADAGEIAATAMTQFGLAGKDLPHVADLLAAGAGKAQGSVTDLAFALKYVGPVAHSMGLSIEETTGSIAELSSQGIIGEQAGTSLRGMLLTLSSPSTIAAEKMKELGLNIYDASGKMLPFADIAQQLHDKVGGLDEATRNQTLGQIFSNAQITAATIIMKGGATAVEDWTAKVNDSGFALEQARRLTDNLKGDVERLGGAFDTALISSGENANGVLREMVQQATGLVDIYNSLPGPIKTAGTATVGLTTAVGLLGGGFLIAAPRITATRRALGEMGRTGALALRGLSGAKNLILGPWGLALGAATIGLGILASKHADAVAAEQEFRDALDQTTGALTNQALAVKAKQLGDNGTLKTAAKLGASIEDVTLAATGNAQAMARLNDAQHGAQVTAQTLVARLTAMGEFVPAAATAGRTYTEVLQNQALQAVQTAQAYGVLTGDIADQGEQAGKSADAVRLVAQALAGAGTGADAASGGLHRMGGAADQAGNDIDDLKTKLDALNGVHLSSRAAARAYEQALDDASKALKENGKSLDINHDKGRQNQAALDAIASSAGDVAEQILDETGSEAKMRASLRHSRTDLTATAVKFGLSKKAAEGYADQVLGIPASASTQARFDASSAEAAIAAYKASLRDLNRSVTAAEHDLSTGSPGGTRKAHGGFISGAGTGTSDSIPARLSNGEFVIRASQTAKHRPLLEDINAGVRGFADGGYVQGFAGGGEATFTAADFSGIISRIPTSSPSRTDIADLRAREARATRALLNAEDALDRVRGRKGHTAADVARSERALTNARESVQSATSRLNAAEQARHAAARPFSGRFHASATADTRQVRAFLRDIDHLRRWGFNNLADQLLTAGDDDAMRLAREAAHSSRVARTINRDVRNSATQQGRLDSRQAAVSARTQRPADFRSFIGSGSAAARTSAAFLADVQAIAARGFGSLAQQLLQLGPEDGADFAHRARAMTSRALSSADRGFQRQAAQTAAADRLPARLAIQAAIARGGNPSLAQLAATTGLSTSDLQAAAISMRAQLGGTPRASRLLGGLNATSSFNAAAAGTTAGGDAITVQVTSTGNPWRDGERALAGARRVRAISRGRW